MISKIYIDNIPFKYNKGRSSIYLNVKFYKPIVNINCFVGDHVTYSSGRTKLNLGTYVCISLSPDRSRRMKFGNTFGELLY